MESPLVVREMLSPGINSAVGDDAGQIGRARLTVDRSPRFGEVFGPLQPYIYIYIYI